MRYRAGYRARLCGALTGLTLATAVMCPTVWGQRRTDAVLVLPLVPEHPGDSAYTVELVSTARSRLEGWRRGRVHVIPYCQVTNFCEQLVPDTAVRSHAALVTSDVVIATRLRRRSAPVVELRILETGRQSGVFHYITSLTVTGDPGVSAENLGRLVGESLRDTLGTILDATHDARDCWAEVGARDYSDAIDEAKRVLAVYPKHASAALCLAHAYASREQTRDSVVGALELAVTGDSTLVDAWERLGQEYLARGDTLEAVRARRYEVYAVPYDTERRLRIAALMDDLGHTEVAVELVRDGMDRAAERADLSELLRRMCLQYEMWECALETLAQQYELDSSLVGDTTFYFQAVGLAQTIGDTAAMLHWTDEAVRGIRQVVQQAWTRVEEAQRGAERAEAVWSSILMARASALAAAGRRDSALAVYRRIGSDDPEHVAAPLAAAQLLTAGPVDTTAWSIADSLLVAVAERADSEAVRQSVAAIYLNAGMRLVQARAAAELAANWLDQALRYGTDSQIVARAQLFRAVALFYVIQEVDLRVRAEQTCDLVAREEELVVEGWSAADAARAHYPEAIGQVVAGLEAYERAVEELRTALRCAPG